jgi:hypothetical protein
LVNSKSKSVKVFRKIVWVSIPSNFFDKVFDGGLHGQRTIILQELSVFKAAGEKLGMSIKGGSKGMGYNPTEKTDEGIFISAMMREKLKIRIRVTVFNATFNNISFILWQSVLLVDETGVAAENHRLPGCHA